jgi:hypothetical protein
MTNIQISNLENYGCTVILEKVKLTRQIHNTKPTGDYIRTEYLRKGLQHLYVFRILQMNALPSSLSFMMAMY